VSHGCSLNNVVDHSEELLTTNIKNRSGLVFPESAQHSLTSDHTCPPPLLTNHSHKPDNFLISKEKHTETEECVEEPLKWNRTVSHLNCFLLM